VRVDKKKKKQTLPFCLFYYSQFFVQLNNKSHRLWNFLVGRTYICRALFYSDLLTEFESKELFLNMSCLFIYLFIYPQTIHLLGLHRIPYTYVSFPHLRGLEL